MRFHQGKFFKSIIRAVSLGLAVSLFFIIVSEYPNIKAKTAEKEQAIEAKANSLHEENAEDPTFVYRFSRVLIYSANDKKANAVDYFLNNQKSSITSPAFIITNVDDDTALLEKNADKLMPIASITKLVTAVVASEVFDKDKYIEITKGALATEGDTGSFKLGEKLKVKEIFYPLLMVSSNDAAEALARSYGRSGFINRMNDWVNSIGAYRTYFRDPSGLSPDNVSTARDIATIASWIKKNKPEIFDITMTKTKVVRSHTWTNPTHFLNISAYEGGKNGYTPEALLTNISLFSLGDPKKTYAVALLRSSDRDNDTLEALREALKK